MKEVLLLIRLVFNFLRKVIFKHFGGGGHGGNRKEPRNEMANMVISILSGFIPNNSYNPKDSVFHYNSKI